ncbi:cobalt-zinc-cadmium resistance protein CzcB [Thermotomaculum hydrothermale]|uniref:Cobalt-zinc-cadmium resistance protein CzcB n=1 Tax=Thermotomaculum hydrothermale TaxID=981385 RepID=A0A7R6PY51_9BACT|nr:efflux RND transporter periplasmic adaptor subunit [Thermotomaculum hydrothermale]BBB31738.1 cobalt-zinc-cadmium resistance protein CzcB [Thermotomaculum hydrothermale]
MRKKLLFVMIVLIVGLAGFFINEQVKASNKNETEIEKNETGEKEKEFEEKISLTKDEIKEFGIETVPAISRLIESEIHLPGEINLNYDKTARISPRVKGKTVKVLKGLGDKVKKGDTLAIISSRELANAKAEYLASIERLKLAKTVLEREKKLWEKQITSQQEYLEAQKNYTEAKINYTTIKQKLYSFGIKGTELKNLEKDGNTDLTLYTIKAPFDGIILTKNISVGENVNEDTEIYTISDLSTVWAIITIYPQYLNYINIGHKVYIKFNNGIKDVKGKIDFIAPVVGEETRTATARVVIKNPKLHYKPGMFFTAEVKLPGKVAEVTVPLTAFQEIEGEKYVFVKKGKYFEPRKVKIGRTNNKFAEILEGVKKGEEVVYKGSFTLKAQMTKDSFADEEE